jgi:hypothetical protein
MKRKFAKRKFASHENAALPAALRVLSSTHSYLAEARSGACAGAMGRALGHAHTAGGSKRMGACHPGPAKNFRDGASFHYDAAALRLRPPTRG